MCGVKKFIYLVQQSREVVVLPLEERKTCVSEGPPPSCEQQGLWLQQGSLYANFPGGCSVLAFGKGAQ